MAMTLNQLRYFCTAAQYHNITQAAKSLFVTQPTISIAIRELEKEFSVPLFHTTKNRLELTPDGEYFYRRAYQILESSEQLRQEFVNRGSFTSKIRMGIPPVLSIIFFPELIDAFHEQRPNVFLELEEYGSARACDMVQDERLDVALVNMEMHNIDKFYNLVLYHEQLLCCVSREHPLADKKRITVDDIKDEHLVLFNGDSVQNHLIQARFDAQQLTPRVILRCSQLHTTLKFVRRGDCACFLFSNMLPHFPELVGIPMDPPLHTKIGMVWKKGKYVSAEMEQLIKFCGEHYQR